MRTAISVDLVQVFDGHNSVRIKKVYWNVCLLYVQLKYASTLNNVFFFPVSLRRGKLKNVECEVNYAANYAMNNAVKFRAETEILLNDFPSVVAQLNRQ